MSWFVTCICLHLLIFCSGGNELCRELHATTCPDGFLHLESRCYKLVQTAKTWNESNIYCQNVFGGHLAVVDVSNVYNGLTSLVTNTNQGFAWIGAKYFHSSRGFQWVNGRSCCPPTWWMQNALRDTKEGDCLVLVNYQSYFGFYYTGCNSSGSFICETKGRKVENCQKYHFPSTRESFCTQCKTGFQLVNNGSVCFDIGAPLHIKCFHSCIVIFIKPQTWADARDICNARNGHLYVPEIPNEDYSFRNYLEAIISSDKMFWVGGKLLQTMQSQWVDNLSVPSERWSNKPETMNEDLCIAMDPRDRYRLKAVSCMEPLFFICQERTPFNIFAVG